MKNRLVNHILIATLLIILPSMSVQADDEKNKEEQACSSPNAEKGEVETKSFVPTIKKPPIKG